MINFKISAVAVAILLLNGCAIKKSIDENSSVNEQSFKQSTTAREITNNMYRSGAVLEVKRPKIAGREVILSKDELPAIFNKKMSYQTLGAQTLQDIVQSVSGMIGIPIRMFEAIDSSSTSAASSSSGNVSSGGGASFVKDKVTFEINGTFENFLNEIANRMDISWKYNKENHSVEFFKFQTKSFSLHIPSGAKSINANISLNGGGGSTGGGGPSGNVAVDHSLKVNPWAAVMSGIAGILHVKSEGAGAASGGASGGEDKLSVQSTYGHAVGNPDLGLLTVTARPQFIQRVGSYIDSINNKFGKNVLIDVKVLEVSLDDSATAGVSMGFLKDKLGRYALSIVSSDVLQPSVGTPGRVTLDTTNKSGSLLLNTVVDALSQVGKVSLQSQGQVIAVNGQPAPFQQAREITYVASSATSAVPNAGVVTTVTPGSKMVGFTANFLPLTLDDNRILLQYQLQTSSLLALRQISSGSITTQLPEIASQSLQQQAFLQDGQAIMLFGFEQERTNNADNTGLLSLSTDTRRQKAMTVVLIQVRTSTSESNTKGL